MSTFPLIFCLPSRDSNFLGCCLFPPAGFIGLLSCHLGFPLKCRWRRGCPHSATHSSGAERKHEGPVSVPKGGQQKNGWSDFNWEMKNRTTGGASFLTGTLQNDNSYTSNGTCAKSHMITIGSEAELTLNQLK